ncbi:hypothetical protein D6C98_08728 [Aureobasidium pullulans]|nr:hypothetical protein D6C98_08728 [Aureobasidium pullulans]
MHGGPKEQFFCPIKHCKRNTKKFTRREHLQEHLRRVRKRQDVDTAEAAGQDAPLPGTTASDHNPDDECRATKRKHIGAGSHTEDLSEECISAQLMELKHENLELRRLWEAYRKEIDEMRTLVSRLETQGHMQSPGRRSDGTA